MYPPPTLTELTLTYNRLLCLSTLPQAARAIYRERPPADDLRWGRARELTDALAARHGVTPKTIRDVWNRRCGPRATPDSVA